MISSADGSYLCLLHRNLSRILFSVIEQRKIREESWKLFLGPLLLTWSCGVVVITSALHAEGPQFDPGRDHRIFHFI